ncbi:hypothetical protein H9P43_002727 [Blastocladiella emersonii ATCC 22665]|nr:hypothetical protein H9P43_002727 [Blastocladiella emersonii ATCC 22665]
MSSGPSSVSFASALSTLFRAVPRDLADLSRAQSLALAAFAAVSVCFSIIDINALLFPSRELALLKWTNDAAAGREVWQRALMTLSGVASVTGCLSVVLAALGRYSTYFWGTINAVCYGLAAFAYGYVGDGQLNAYFVVMQVVGMLAWARNIDNADTATARSLSWLARGAVVAACTAFGCVMYFEIPWVATALTGAYAYDGVLAPHVLDSAAVATQVLAQVLMTGRFWEQWILWIAADVIQIVMFSGLVSVNAFDFNILIMWSLFLINALYGATTWYRRAQVPDAERPESSAATLVPSADAADAAAAKV